MEESQKKDSLITVQAIIHGFVQGVGFRAATRALAQKIGLRGTVQNLPNGKVEIHAQGSEEQIACLLRSIKEDSFVGSVDRVEEIRPSRKKSFKEFNIIFP